MTPYLLHQFTDFAMQSREECVATQTRLHEVEKSHKVLWHDFRTLESTMEELMTAYEQNIALTKTLKAEHRAKDELRELEIDRLRTALKSSDSKIIVCRLVCC